MKYLLLLATVLSLTACQSMGKILAGAGHGLQNSKRSQTYNCEQVLGTSPTQYVCKN